MANIREILAENMRENRRRLGITQSELAEKANISTNFVAMIELKQKFPSPEIMEQIAGALGIDTPMLFAAQVSAEQSLEKLHQAILDNLDQTIGKAVDRAIDEKLKNGKLRS